MVVSGLDILGSDRRANPEFFRDLVAEPLFDTLFFVVRAWMRVG